MLTLLAAAGCGSVPRAPDSVPFEMLASFDVGRAPHQIVFSPDGSEACIAVSGADRLMRVNTANFAPLRGEVISGTPLGVAYAGDASGRVVATQFRADQLVEAAGSKSQDLLELADGPSFLVPLTGGRFLVSAERSNQLFVIDAEGWSKTANYATGARPFPPAPTSDGRKAFVPNHDDGTVSIIDLWNGELRDTVAVGEQPTGGVVLPGDLQYAVALRGENRVAFVGVGTHEVEGELVEGIGEGPFSVVTTRDGAFAFVNNADSHDVSVIDLSTRAVVHRIETGEIPIALAVDPTDRQLWVSCEGSHEVQVFALPERKVAPTAEQMPQTQVAVLGMIHRGHRTSETWNLKHVEQTIRNYGPDVICVEIPPNRWHKTASDYAERSVVEDSRSKVFPEYVDVVMPLTKSDDLGGSFIIEPCAGWTHEMNALRRARINEFQTAERFKEAAAAYKRDRAAAQAATARMTGTEDPAVIHTLQYDEATRKQFGPYDHYLNDHIGPGGWTNINQAHWDLVDAAIRKHAGKRVMVTFGAGHKYWILDQLRKMPWVEIVDVRRYLPRP